MRWAPTLAVALATILVGCSSGSSGGNSGVCPGACDPCSLLTQDQVSSVLGVPVGPGSIAPGGNSDTCDWTYAPSGPANSVSAGLETKVSTDVYSQICNPNVLTTPISGVGDAACYSALGNPEVVFEKAGAAYIVSITASGTYATQFVDPQQQLTTLAQDVLANL
jgi:hypothetical protein